jgi:Domain of unknown function (DUF6089)
MIRLFLISVLFISTNTTAQHSFFNVLAGGTHYSGDLGNAPIPSLIYPAGGIGFGVELNNRMLINANFFYGKIGGHDKFNKRTKERNLSFYSHLAEFSLQFEYNLFDLYDYKVTPHFFVGAGVFNYTPYAKVGDNIVYLQSLNTEGQGFFEGRKKYKTTQLSIPFGGGITWAINDNKRLSIFSGIRKTFTDYLDDVSTTYVDYTTLLNNRGGNAVALAFRGGELGNGATYPTEGTQRGNAKNKDYYYFSGVCFRMRMLPPKRRGERSQRFKKGNTACPVVY